MRERSGCVSWRVVGCFLVLLSACARPIPHPPSCPTDCPRARSPVSTDRSAATSFVHRVGLGLVDESGRPLKLRGVALGGWLLWEGWIWGGGLTLLHMWGQSESAIKERLAEAAGPAALCRFREGVRDRFITEADIAAIARAGLNVVRVPLNHRDFACEGSPGWTALDRLLDWCEAHHVHAVLDLHSAPGGQTKLFIADPERVLLWDSPEAEDRTVAFWGAVARRYAGRAVVAGYDLLNEPNPPKGSDLVDLDRRIVAAIRAVDTHHTIIVEGTDAARDFSMFKAPLDDNQVYSFHLYTWFGDDRAARLRGFAEVAAAQGVPMWCGEFGENTLPMLDSTLDMFDAQTPALVGWSFWTWKRTGATRWPALNGIALPVGWQKLIDWAVDDRGAQPTPEAAQASMDAFLDAADYSRVMPSPGLTATLASHARR